jgi:hypothetical protein
MIRTARNPSPAPLTSGPAMPLTPAQAEQAIKDTRPNPST